jgi:RNA polymerase sigma factor (sigma-70 family)
MTPPPEELERALRGDPEAREALGAWCLRHAFDVAFIVLGRVPNRDTIAEEVAGEASMKALANLHRFDPATHFTAWLNTIVRHCACDYFRREARALPHTLYQRWVQEFVTTHQREWEARVAGMPDEPSARALLQRIGRDLYGSSYSQFMQLSYPEPAARLLEQVKEALSAYLGAELRALSGLEMEEWVEEVPSDEEPAETGLMQEEFVQQVNARLSELEPLCRRLIRWYYLQQMKMTEIARIEQWPERTAYRRLEKCEAALRDCLTRDDYFSEFAGRAGVPPITAIPRGRSGPRCSPQRAEMSRQPSEKTGGRST